MNIVVTGATGFVGTWLVDKLLEQGNKVTILVRNCGKVKREWIDKGVSVIEANIFSLNDLPLDDFDDTNDLFFHLAWAGTSGMERADISLQLNNVNATCEAVKLAKRLGCKRFVNAGSIMEYEAMEYLQQNKCQPGMGYIYSTAKLTADFMAKTVATEESIDYISVIISNIYGVGECSARFLNTTLMKMLRNDTIALTQGTQLYDFIYVEDAVQEIIVAGIHGNSNESYYIGNCKQRPLREFVDRMKRAIKSESVLDYGAVPFCGVQLTYNEFDTTKVFDELGYSPQISFEEGILRTAEWMKMEENNEHQI